MEKFDYSKAEIIIEKAVQNMYKALLEKKKPIRSKWAAEFYGMQNKPNPEDSVESILAEEPEDGDNNNSSIELTEERTDETDELSYVIESTPYNESITHARKKKYIEPGNAISFKNEEYLEEGIAQQELIDPLFLLRKHILWFKIKGLKDRYEQIGTTQEEIFALRKKKFLLPKDLERVTQLNVQAKRVKEHILKKESLVSNEEIIEFQKKKHKNKFHSVRDRWLKL